MTLDDLLIDPPQIHEDPAGNIHGDWALSDEALRYIAARVGPGSRTLETGAGLSTALFLSLGCRHTAISPDAGEFERLLSYCARTGISADQADLRSGNSATVLPGLHLSALDFVLIDGGHAFPLPFLDWYHSAAALRVNGLIMVDDVQLWTGATLAGFLAEEPGWQPAGRPDRTVVFRKNAPFDPLRSWTRQPFTARQSLIWLDGGWRPHPSAPTPSSDRTEKGEPWIR